MIEQELYRNLDLFHGCAPETVHEIVANARIHAYPAYAEIIGEGHASDFLHVVLSGLVQLVARDNGHETTMAVLEPPDTFIMAAVFLGRTHLQTARALEPAKVLLLPGAPIRALARRDIALANNVSAELAAAYRVMVQELKNHKLRPGLQRLANWLVRRDIEAGRTGKLVIPYEKKVLAARLGMAPEILSRSFATLAKYDVVVEGRQVEIRDMKALLRLARPSPLIDDPTA